MESISQATFSPSSNKLSNDLVDSEIAKLSMRMNSLLQTPPRKRQNPEDEINNDLLTSSPIPPSATLIVAEVQPSQQEQTEEIVQEKPVEKKEEEQPKKAKCRYCDESFATDSIRNHQDNCDKRTIDCEACGEKVELDIFDFHLEICSARVDPYEAMLHAAQQQFLASLGLQNNANNEQSEEEVPNEQNADQENNENEEEEGNVAPHEGEEALEGENNSESYEESDGFDPDQLTYEQLLTLDNTIVKKGMTDEQLKNLPVKIYLKALDGPVSCSVCLSECESGEVLRELCCGHKFHKDCVDTWLENHITCPVCKKYLR